MTYRAIALNRQAAQPDIEINPRVGHIFIDATNGVDVDLLQDIRLAQPSRQSLVHPESDHAPQPVSIMVTKSSEDLNAATFDLVNPLLDLNGISHG